jgi:hypothetical protein
LRGSDRKSLPYLYFEVIHMDNTQDDDIEMFLRYEQREEDRNNTLYAKEEKILNEENHCHCAHPCVTCTCGMRSKVR